MSKKYLIGIDIGGTKTCVAAADYSGGILAQRKFPTGNGRGQEAVLEVIYRAVEEVCEQAGMSREQIGEIGISCPGPVDLEKGILYSPPNLPGWDEVPIRRLFQDKFHKTVWVENDANAAALAEMYFGAGRGYANIVYLTMSTGIGAGIIINGNLIRGAHSSAGEAGHNVLIPDGPECMCGRRGCFEALCSGTAISRRMREIAAKKPEVLWLKKTNGGIEMLAPPILLESAREGDAQSLELLEEAGYYLGLGCAQIVNILDPEVIILGTLAIYFGELLLKPAEKSFQEHLFFHSEKPTSIIPAMLKERLAEMAAVSVVLQYYR